MTIDEILITARAEEAGEVLLLAEYPPMMRVNGQLCKMGYPRLSASVILDMLIRLLPQQRRNAFEENGSCISLYVSGDGIRCRVTGYRQNGSVAMAIRLISERLPDAQELPEAVLECSLQPGGGMILVSGGVGSGRTTTLAMLAEFICSRKQVHMMFVEQASEYLPERGSSVISRRVCGQDMNDMESGITEAALMGVDVLLVDELAGTEAVKRAIRAASMGILVIAAVGAHPSGDGVEALAAAFPLKERGDISGQLRMVVKGQVAL